MAQRTCTRPGCDKPHRARGLCASHYNQEHAPNRHRAKTVACVICGATVVRAGGGGRRLGATCSTRCRRRAQDMLRGERSELPADHWARWYGATSEWPRYGLADCAQCGARFVKRAPGSTVCSASCGARRSAGVVLSQAEHEKLLLTCPWCNVEFRTPWIGQVYCSHECRSKANRKRNPQAWTNWISTRRRRAIYERDGYICQLCGDPVDLTDDPQRGPLAPSLDHIIPRSKGGGHESSNLRTAHRLCNALRGDRDDLGVFAPALVAA